MMEEERVRHKNWEGEKVKWFNTTLDNATRQMLTVNKEYSTVTDSKRVRSWSTLRSCSWIMNIITLLFNPGR